MPNETTDFIPQPGAQSFEWQIEGQSLNVAFDVAGAGPPILLLPGMGPASTRAEMWPVARQLQDRFEIFSVDLPGFGASPQPSIRWQPEHYRAFLTDFCAHQFDVPVGVVAVGHTSTYVLQVARDRPETWSRIVMIGPTWRGPQSTSRHLPSSLYPMLRRFVELPLVGEALYRLSVVPTELERLFRTRLYGSMANITPRLITEKRRVAHQKNARFAVGAFLTGALDAILDPADYTQLIADQLVPILAVCGHETPASCWQDIAFLLQRPEVTLSRIPGALAPHEEHPAPVSRLLSDFFSNRSV